MAEPQDSIDAAETELETAIAAAPHTKLKRQYQAILNEIRALPDIQAAVARQAIAEATSAANQVIEDAFRAGGWANGTEVNPLTALSAQLAPTGLTSAAGTPDSTAVDLEWEFPDINSLVVVPESDPAEYSFVIQRATNAGFTTGTGTTAVDSVVTTGKYAGSVGSLTAETAYWFRVKAVTKFGESAYSSAVTRTTAAA